MTEITWIKEMLSYYHEGQCDIAEKYAREKLAAGWDDPTAEAITIVGACCMRDQRFVEAVEWFKSATMMVPESARAWANLCAALRETNDPEESTKAGLTSCQLEGANATYLLNASLSAVQADRPSLSRHLVLTAMALEPENADTHVSLGASLVREGQYAAGFRELAWSAKRPGEKEMVPPGLRTIPWNGMKLYEPLVVVCDQGFGDAIFFSRWLKHLKPYCEEVIVAGPKELGILGQLCDRFQSDYSTLPPNFFHVRMSHLPLFFEVPSVPDRNYISAPIGWTRLNPQKKHVGLFWRGREVPRGRSIPFKLLADALLPYRKDTIFWCLQPDVTDEERFMLPMVSVPLQSFQDTAETIQSLDHVITIDSAVVHLAGALGANTTVLLSNGNLWVWGLGKSGSSPFYPSVEMVKQVRPGDWSYPLEQVQKRLAIALYTA